VFQTNTVNWTPEEINQALQVYTKIGLCYDSVLPKDHPLPQEVYEAKARVEKLLAVELVLLRGDDIYLVKRPSIEVAPHEPWPNQLHIPGTTFVPSETRDHAWERLVQEDLNGANMKHVQMVGPLDYHAPPRGVVTTLIHKAYTDDDPANDQGEFYPIGWTLQSDEVISFHRELLIPFALK
jgi:ADP-ribose pyrophosphatase YjhB (NUDIX family)